MEHIFIDIYNSLCVNHTKTIDKTIQILENALKKSSDIIKRKDIDKEIQKLLEKIDSLVELKINKKIDIMVYENK